MWAIIFISTRHEYTGRKGKWITSCSTLQSTVQSSVQKCWNQESAQECELTCFFLGNITHSWVACRRHIWNSSAASSSFSSCYDIKNQELMFLQRTPPSSSYFVGYSKFLLTENVNDRCDLTSSILDYWCLWQKWDTASNILNYTGLPSAQKQRFCNIPHLWFNPKLREEEQGLFWADSS